MKGLVGELGEMNIELKPNSPLIKKRSYKMNLHYEEVRHKIDKMLDHGLIF
jgi:hypothetical protein